MFWAEPPTPITMNPYEMIKKSARIHWLISLFIVMAAVNPALAGSVKMTDAAGRTLVFEKTPEKIACLAPHITQILVDLGQARRIAVLTRQDLVFHAGVRAMNSGSYFRPDLSVVEACDPDLIICTPGQAEQIEQALGQTTPLLVMTAATMDQAFDQVRQMGQLFDCQDKAAQLLGQIKDQMTMVAQRLTHLDNPEKKRVVRVMAGKTLSCPGADSFQNEMIRAAGGRIPDWTKKGFAVEVDPSAWQDFNPQVIYGCTANAHKVRKLLATEPFKNVDAVKNGQVHFFPCELTCRVTTRTGDFIQWLAAVIYPDVFADPDLALTRDKPLYWRSLSLNQDYVDIARVVGHRLADTPYKSLVLRFTSPQTILSTFEGLRENQAGCGNTFIPMAASLGHMRKGVTRVKQTLEKNLGFSQGKFSTLMTGADMDNLAVVEKTYKDLRVTALVTAGVRGNAMRLSKDTGYYLSHGTINIIVGCNRKLSVAAMSRAVITVTEAKTAALTDLDIRSRYTPWVNPATGTGTDNVLVIQGEGPWVAFAGGHSKIAQLMAEAVHQGVTQAIAGQNGILAGRDIFQRLAERGLSLEALVRQFDSTLPLGPLVAGVESLLNHPHYSAFLESALAVSDAQDRNLITDKAFWDETCQTIVFKICGKRLLPSICRSDKIPPALSMTLGSLIKGIETKKELHP